METKPEPTAASLTLYFVVTALNEEQNDVLDLVRRRNGEVPVDELLGSAEEHEGRVASSMADLVTTEQADQIAAGVVGVVRRRVSACLAEEAGDVDRILVRIRSIYRDVRSHQVREVVGASGAAA